MIGFKLRIHSTPRARTGRSKHGDRNSASHSDGFELGLRLAYLLREGQYEVGVFGRNLADEEIVQNGIDFNNLTGMTNEPRTWGIELVSRF